MFPVTFRRVLSSNAVRIQSKWIYSRNHSSSMPLNPELGSEGRQEKEDVAILANTSNLPISQDSFSSSSNVFGHDSQLNFDLVSQLRAERTLRLPMLDPRTDLSGQEDCSSLQFSQTIKLEGCSFKLPSVSAVINDTMSAESLARLDEWKRGMISKLGQEGFENYQKGIFARGRKLHKNLEHKLGGKEEEKLSISKDIEGCWQSLQHVFDDIGSVRLLEQRVVHPLLLYRGIVDCVATVGDTLHVIDWKTSEKSKDTIGKLYDAPIQAVAYLGALNYDLRLLRMPLKNVAIVVAYENGRAADMHKLSEKDCERFWKVWMQRLHEYWFKRLPKPMASDEDKNLSFTSSTISSRTHARSSTLKVKSTSTVKLTSAKESKSLSSSSSSYLESNISLQLNSIDEQLRSLNVQVKNLQTTVDKLKGDLEKQSKSEIKKNKNS